MPGQTLQYRYDTAGRLQAMTDSLRPQELQHWALDPAGNRLPGKPENQQQQQDHWAGQVHRNWREQVFNLLGQGQNMPEQQGQIDKWQDNRIGYHQGSAWRYDPYGNRTEQVSQHSNG
jgi:hypothetical protein